MQHYKIITAQNYTYFVSNLLTSKKIYVYFRRCEVTKVFGNDTNIDVGWKLTDVIK